MALKASDITVESYVHVGDKLVNVDELPPDLKVRFATELSITYLNALYKGKAKFFVAGENPDGERRLKQFQPVITE